MFKRIAAALLCLIMAISMVACGGNGDAPETTPAPTEPTNAPDVTTAPEATEPEATEPEATEPEATEPEATEPETTEEPTPVAPIEFGDLPASEQAALKALMPVSLPDFSSYEIYCRTMCFDRGLDDYYVEGNSAGSVQFVDVANGALYGQAIKMAAINDEGTNRAEIQILPYGDVNVSEAKGVMFYVDFSNVQLHTDPEKKMCTSVTLNTNDYRAQGPEKTTGSGIAYYYTAGSWVQTTNINACRMEIPANFAGWIYIPASTFYGKNEASALGETFGDILVMNMRCYTDGYTYSADNYIIFDENVFVK